MKDVYFLPYRLLPVLPTILHSLDQPTDQELSSQQPLTTHRRWQWQQ